MKNILFVLFLLSNLNIEAQTWDQLQKINPDDREVNDEFGNAVAISGDYAIIGAKREDDNGNDQNPLADAGSAYIFKQVNGTWTQEAKLVAADREANDFFGDAVAISGTYCIVGAHQEGDPAHAGAAYIFERSAGGTWVQAAKLEAPIRKSSDHFGFSVGISGDYAVVGAYFEDEDENETNEVLSAGSAYIFKRNNSSNTWELYQKIVASDRSIDDRFGMSAAISGEHIIIGAEFDDVDGPLGIGSNAGSAYIFSIEGGLWVEKAHLTASDYGQSEHFGWSVAISGNHAIVGAYQNGTDELGLNGKPGAGAAYIYEQNNGLWAQVKKMVASDRADIDFYGYAVAMDGDQALVGAYRQNFAESGSPMFSDAGAAYLLMRNNEGEWFEVQKINHEDRSTLDLFGFAVAMDNNNIIIGSPSEDEDQNIDHPLQDAGSVYFFTEQTNATAETIGEKFKIFPNPASQILYIEVESIPSAEVYIHDAQGRLLLKTNLNDPVSAIDIHALKAGMYFLSLKTKRKYLGVRKITIF